MSKPGKPSKLRIEAMYAGLQSSHWLTVCIFSGFMTVYLSHYGFSDTLIGLTSSLISIITVAFQLFASSYCDKNPHIPIKRTAIIIYLAFLLLAGLLALIPLPIILMLVVYSLAGGLINAIPGLYNALIMQFVNLGLPVNFGWPRGVSATIYASAAFFLGLMLERYDASILMPLSLAALAIAFFFAFTMPKPTPAGEACPVHLKDRSTPHTSFRHLLASSRVLQVFLLASILMNAGQANNLVFLPRIISSAGGSQTSLGIAMSLQVGMEMPGLLLSPFLLRHVRARALLTASFVSYLGKALIILLAKGLPGIMIAMASSVFCFGLYAISSVYFVNDIVKPHEKVRAQVLVSTSGALAAIVANPLAGVIVDRYGVGTLNLVSVIIQSMALMMMLLCAWLQNEGEKTSPSQRQ